MNLSDNPHFKWIDRAPYEIGHLLRDLPQNFCVHKEQPSNVYKLAAALERHTDNATSTLLSGLEAIGHVMFSAVNNQECPPNANTIASLGCLVAHLSVELQFLIELNQECSDMTSKGEALAANKERAK